MPRLSFVDVDLEEEEEEEVEFYLSKFSFETDRPLRPRRSFYRTSLISSLSFVNLRHSFQYNKLPQVPIHLTVVKLDGSCFAIKVENTAKVSDLKLAVEMAFSDMPRKGPGKISWWHVWGHFCLSYDGQKLVNDDELIRYYGIRDGDELLFVRHVSASCNLTKKRSKKRVDALKASRTPDVLEGFDEEDDCDQLENLKCQQCRHEDEGPVMYRDSSLLRFLPHPQPRVLSSTQHNESPIPSEPCLPTISNPVSFVGSHVIPENLSSKTAMSNIVPSRASFPFPLSPRHKRPNASFCIPQPQQLPAMANMLMASSSKSLISVNTTTPKPKPFLLPKLPLLTLPAPPLKRLIISPPAPLKSVTSAVVASMSLSYLLPLPSLAEEIEKAALFDFNLTLPIIMAEILLLRFALDKIYFTPLGNFIDERDAAIKEKLASVKDTSEEVKQLDEQAAAVMRAARAEISAALNKMKKETTLEVEAKLAEGRKKVEAELQEALANLEKQKEDTIKALDSQIAALSDEIVKKVLPA
ncbi:hypothetical protein Nepgr_014298 [Nepenthes gracilis]|uniref:SNRNP25 ubiquitin-like domain-containing protein n=1 Tax=Nepenthes gracilis TaxID=150966 RepID=A0AAD3SJS5_NEPGR|nr:hypothetical protein Nepgr_014298 [Nepenthes gracilis]